jgi:hypothetical protein
MVSLNGEIDAITGDNCRVWGIKVQRGVWGYFNRKILPLPRRRFLLVAARLVALITQLK